MKNINQIARILRRNQTREEEKLWNLLRNHQLCGVKASLIVSPLVNA